MINGVNAIGLVSGPAFNLFFSKLDYEYRGVKLNALTAPGWFVALLLVVSFFLFAVVFREPNHAAAVGIPVKKPTISQHLNFILSSFTKPYGVCFLVCFVQNFDFSVLEAITTPLTERYGFGPFQNSLLYSFISVTMIVVIVATLIMSKYIQDRYILVGGQLFMGAGLILMYTFFDKIIPLVYFCGTIAILVCGLPSQNTAIMSTYSKLLTAEFGQSGQGLYTGVMMLFGSLARIVGPLWGGYMVSNLNILFTLLLAMFVIDVLFTLLSFRKLDPQVNNTQVSQVSQSINTEASLLIPEMG